MAVLVKGLVEVEGFAALEDTVTRMVKGARVIPLSDEDAEGDDSTLLVGIRTRKNCTQAVREIISEFGIVVR